MNEGLERHLSAMQTTAIQLENLAAALESTIAHCAREDMNLTLVDAVLELAKELNRGLDIVSLHAAETQGPEA